MDHDRPLNKRGERDAPLMAQRLADYLTAQNETLDSLFSSSAVRALGIAKPIAEKLGVEQQVCPELYTFSAHALLDFIKSIDAAYQHVALVGHNPAITDLVNHLLGNITDNVPTSSIVAISCDCTHWSDLTNYSCHLDYFDYPKRQSNIL